MAQCPLTHRPSHSISVAVFINPTFLFDVEFVDPSLSYSFDFEWRINATYTFTGFLLHRMAEHMQNELLAYLR